MKVLLWHGYLLRGSGSNVYTANVAARMRAEGHDVVILCQERAVADLGFVDGHGDFADDNLAFTTSTTASRTGAGSVAVLRPAIGEVLPVYVYDAYEGFTAKRFVDLTDEELRTYTDANVVALTTAVERFGPDALIVGHEVMGPEIARRSLEMTGTSYVAKLHGSALEFAVKEQDRYRRAAASGLSTAKAVVGGSNYMVQAALDVVPGWAERAAVVNPGCDVELFAPQPKQVDAPPRVGFVGKFIASKGVHLLLAALGVTQTPHLHAVVVGYGALDEVLRRLHRALAEGDVAAARSLVRAADVDAPGFAPLARFLEEGADEEYLARAAAVPVEFTGRLEHGPLSVLLPTFDVMVVPSVLPEAFGMVAAEAAACGVLPVAPRHSGIAEAVQTIEESLGAPGLLTYDPEQPIVGIAAAVDRVLKISPPERASLGLAAAELARRRWSWSTVARRLLELAR